MRIDQEKCVGCAECLSICPLSAIRIRDKKAYIDEKCSDCGACFRVCQSSAICAEHIPTEYYVQCTACPIECKIKKGFWGACKRYQKPKRRVESSYQIKNIRGCKGSRGGNLP